MSHSVKKCKGGGLWDLSTYILLQNIKKLEGETFEKKSHSTEKIHKGGPWVSFAFVCYVKKGKHERGRPFALSLRGCNWQQGCHKKRFLRKKQTNMYFIEKNTFFWFFMFFPPLGQWLIENRITAKYSSNSIRY